jgi:endogenous inhibitor of DNA gyrase (YacG/DUF329 family)
MLTEIKCPQCSELSPWQGNPHRPFCSERCRLIDLGQWADEEYRIPGAPQKPFDDADIVKIYEE